jgi:DNA gyrase subunit A
VFMATSQGTVKKTPLTAFSRPRSTGIIAVDLAENDRLIGVAITDSQREIILVSSGGKAIRFHEDEVRPMGREAAGVRGIKLGDGQELIALIVVGEGNILTASAAGYGKQTPLDDFPSHGRGGQGVIALQTSDRNGDTVAALQVTAGHEIMLISSTGTLVRTPVDEISVLGRNTQGVRLIRLAEGERLVGIEHIESLEAADGAVPADVPGDVVPPGSEEPGPESSGPTDTTS